MKRITVLQEQWENRQETLERVMRENKITADDILTGKVKIKIIEPSDKTDPMYFPRK